jgi:gliding motility-associated protein GldC
MNKKSEIHITVELNENKLPVKMNWTSTENNESGECKSFFLAMWDAKEQTSLHLNLWTKDMNVDEMRQFVHQMLLNQSDTLKKATGDEALASTLYDYSHEYAIKAGILKEPTKS